MKLAPAIAQYLSARLLKWPIVQVLDEQRVIKREAFS